jgi:anti-sigma-K factor RskA
MGHDLHDLTAAYALDALEAEERARYERHLESCHRCRDELATMWRTTEELAIAASGPSPPAELRTRILAAARAEAQVIVPLRRRSDRLVQGLAAVTALAAAVALGVGLWAASLRSDLDEARSALATARAAAALLSDPGSRVVSLEAGQGRLFVSPDGRAVVVLRQLERVAPGSTYQLWIVPDGDLTRAKSGGLFEGGEPLAVALLTEKVTRGDVVAVTVEAAGGATAPTSDPIVVSAPV